MVPLSVLLGDIKFNNGFLICFGRSGILTSSYQDIQLPVAYQSFYRGVSSGACWDEPGYCRLTTSICGYLDLGTVHLANRYWGSTIYADYVQYITIGY